MPPRVACGARAPRVLGTHALCARFERNTQSRGDKKNEGDVAIFQTYVQNKLFKTREARQDIPRRARRAAPELLRKH